MPSPMLQPALDYHNEGLCIIPIVERDKMPALEHWESYHSQRSTEADIKQWWGNGHNWNIGIVHGQVSDNYTTLDIDEDNGATDLLFEHHPHLCVGRIEQSGSGQGYHIPLRVNTLPNWGVDNKGRPIGNKTWKIHQAGVYLGKINIRAQRCQTVAPPSIHPTGGLYRYVQHGTITTISSFDSLIAWLDSVGLAPKKQTREYQKGAIQQTSGDNLLGAVLSAFPTCLSVFSHFGMAHQVQVDRDDELRLMGNGGLMLTQDGERWYCFEAEFGGGRFEAWWYARYGNSSYDKYNHFRQVLLEMADAAGIDLAQFYRKGDEKKLEPVKSGGKIWTEKYKMMWERIR